MARKSKNFISSAIKHPGALRKALHAKAGKPISASALKKAASGKGVSATTARRARFAQTLRKLSKRK